MGWGVGGVDPAPAVNLGGLGAFPWPRQAALGWVSILVSKQDLRELAILFPFADEETESYSLSTSNFPSAYSSDGSALLCCASE